MVGLNLTERVFPTHVGMDRISNFMGKPISSVPHARGDGPKGGRLQTFEVWCSPRTWGWTGHQNEIVHRLPVFPTHVGMDRLEGGGACAGAGVPHARGDGPLFRQINFNRSLCSPRTWGWTDPCGTLVRVDLVFPTHVGMDRHLIT